MTQHPTLHSTRLGEQGWRSGESTCLLPMWLEFDSRTQRHMWVEFVVGSYPCSEVFLWILQFSPLLKNQHFQIAIRSGVSPYCKAHLIVLSLICLAHPSRPCLDFPHPCVFAQPHYSPVAPHSLLIVLQRSAQNCDHFYSAIFSDMYHDIPTMYFLAVDHSMVFNRNSRTAAKKPLLKSSREF